MDILKNCKSICIYFWTINVFNPFTIYYLEVIDKIYNKI